MRLSAIGKVRSIYDIPLDTLQRNGFRFILADLDNTLAAYGQPTPDNRLLAWKSELEQRGFSLFVLSNSRSKTRAVNFCNALGVPFLAHAGKPKPDGFHHALSQLGATAQHTVMLGDQIFTDILGASRAGVPAILVEPIRLAGNPGRYLRYAVELPIRAAIKELRL